MQVILVILLFILGLLFIIKGGDYLVDASLLLSKVTNISKIVIGATLMSLGTALPEISVSLIAILNNLHSMAVGNAVGSMICNIALVIGISIIIAPQKIKIIGFKNKAYILLILNILLFLFCLNLDVGYIESIILLICCVIFFFVNFLEVKKTFKKQSSMQKLVIGTPSKNSNIKNYIFLALKFVTGCAGVMVGANLIVHNGEILALMLGVSTQIVGFTIIALGTSLPELITTLTAVKKNSLELALGNVIGANIINITLLFGLGGLMAGIGGLRIPKNISLGSIPILIMITLIFILPILKRHKTYKLQGVILLTIYIIYTLYILSTHIW